MRAGDAVVLSPACASYDMFQNFGHRGRVFREAVERGRREAARCMMRAMRLSLACVVLAACGGKPAPQPPKRAEHRADRRHATSATRPTARPPRGSAPTARSTIAHEKSELDSKPLAKGSWKLDGDQLTLTYDSRRDVPRRRAGHVQGRASKVGIHFTKVEDSCDRRAKMDGQTWFRVR